MEITRVGGATGERSTRVLDEAHAEAEGLFSGPPYGYVEHAFDEYDFEVCSVDVPE